MNRHYSFLSFFLIGVIASATLFGFDLYHHCSAEPKSLNILDELWIPEDDVLTSFIIVSITTEDYIVLRKNTTGPCAFAYVNSQNSYYAGSALDDYLQNTYAKRFPYDALRYFRTSDIEITAEESIGCCGKKAETIKRVFFAPSRTEVTGKYNSTWLREGRLFSQRMHRTYLSATDDKGHPSLWWLRTPNTWHYYRVLEINEEGGVISTSILDSGGTYLADVRPAFRISKQAPIRWINGQWRLDCSSG